MFYESLIILNISTLNFSEGVPASVIASFKAYLGTFLKPLPASCTFTIENNEPDCCIRFTKEIKVRTISKAIINKSRSEVLLLE